MGAVELGRTVREAREARELSYRQLREQTGLALSHLQRLERGEVKEPSPPVLRKLAAALEIPYEQLMAAAGYL